MDFCHGTHCNLEAGVAIERRDDNFDLSSGWRAGMNRIMKSAWLCMIMCAVCLSGCVEREMTITSEPEGALVMVSSVEKGRTPLTMSFTWYGDYDIIVSMDGYETLKAHRNILPPWYEVPPLDFFSQLAPWTYHDRRYLHFVLSRPQPLSKEELKHQAEVMKQENLEPVSH